MKKMLGIILAVVMIAALACAAADAVPQPEGGKKFEGSWAVQNALVQIVYEEEGYRVAIEAVDPDEMRGTEWNYSCYYREDTDSLVSVYAEKCDFIIDADDPGDYRYDNPVYDDPDDESTVSEFAIDDHGCLVWNDGRGDDGEDLEFISIGRFIGSWKNEKEAVDAEFSWNSDDGEFFYSVWIQRGESDADTFVVFDMTGVYDPETGRLACSGTAVTNTKNASGDYDAAEDGEIYEAFFSMTEDGKVLFETDNGIELEHYDSNG